MSRVNWEAKSDYEFIQNYKLLQGAFNKHHVKRHIEVDRLIRAKYQDNLEFCQWLKAFFDQQGVYRPDYDPVAARSKGRGAKKVSQFLDKTASRHNSKPVPTRPRTSTRPTTTTSKPSASTARGSRTTKEKENKRVNPSTAVKGNDVTTDAIIADANLMKKNSELKTKLTEMELTLSEVEKERDFYFEKLRDVEVMLQVHQEKSADEKDPDRLMENVFKVLYATHDDNYTVDESGEVSVVLLCVGIDRSQKLRLISRRICSVSLLTKVCGWRRTRGRARTRGRVGRAAYGYVNGNTFFILVLDR